MAEETAISWADATFNPWIGCTKVSPACDHCYAERDNSRRKWVEGWGPGVPRRRTSPATWNNVRKWNRRALETGAVMRVFCASLADVFDNEVLTEWRYDLFELIRECRHLHWMLLTKRIGNALDMVPMGFGRREYPHVGVMATLANQAEWNRDYPKLENFKRVTDCAWIGVSAEPLLGQIKIGAARPDWIITGGESGPQRRPLDMQAVRDMRDQCLMNGIAFHHKQNGGLCGKDGGCLVDGIEHKAFPWQLNRATHQDEDEI